ncbi:hypothetical protein [Spirosoma aerophilum]
MKTRINPPIEPIVRKFNAALPALYGDRLGTIVPTPVATTMRHPTLT